MNGDVMERLARANPVTEPPQVAPLPSIDQLIEQDSDALAPPRKATGAGGRPPRRRLAAASVFAAAACAAALLALAGSSDRSVNVLAEVYAATAPRGGIVESVTVMRMFGGPGHSTRDELREWAEQASERRRGLTGVRSLDGPAPPAQADKVYSPTVWEAWASPGGLAGIRPLGGRSPRPNVVYRYVWAAGHTPESKSMGFLGSSIVGSQFTAFYRQLYASGGWRVAGHERRGGKLLWRLEETPAQAQRRAREDHTRFYVLVDPTSFLPVYERLIQLTPAGPRTARESELVSYRTLPSTPQNDGVFDLPVQHRGARVITQPGPTVRRR